MFAQTTSSIYSLVGNTATGIGKQIPSIGQLVVNDMKKSSTTKKRRSKEHSNNEDDSSHYTNGKNQNKNCNKETLSKQNDLIDQPTKSGWKDWWIEPKIEAEVFPTTNTRGKKENQLRYTNEFDSIF